MAEEALGALPPEPVRKVRADMLERAEKVWRGRVVGLTWEQAARLGDYSDPSNAVRAVRQVYGTLPVIEREEARRLWRDRLEMLWRQVVQDVHDRMPGATTAAVRVEQAAARLDGLDEPSRVALSAPTEQEIERWVGEVLALSQPQLEQGDIFDVEVIEGP